nr:molybdopterin-dependent oxidoreductase [Micromonospora sp. DSM 115978]
MNACAGAAASTNGERTLTAANLEVAILDRNRTRRLFRRIVGGQLDTLLADVESAAEYAMVQSYGGYTTNVPLEDLLDGQAWIAYRFDGEDLDPEHGGPARMLIPHLYFWKSAKWVRGIQLMNDDEPGFWEALGYHDYGDPWR